MLFTCPVASLVDLMGPDVHGLFLLIIPNTRTPGPFSVSLKRCSGLDVHVVRSTLYVQKVAKNPLRRPSANHVCMTVVIAGSPVANAVQKAYIYVFYANASHDAHVECLGCSYPPVCNEAAMAILVCQ